MIFTDIFDRLCSIFGIPDIDLFASRLNKQLEHYVSWLKTASLIMLLSGHRVNTENLKITNIYTSETECTFVFRSVLKHSRPSYHQQPLILRSFPSNPSLCLVINITQYLKFRLEKSAYEGFFITTVPPYKQCSKDTIARWIKDILSLAGINSGIYQAHSLQSASTSSASYKGVNLSTILKSANWTRNSTFKKYYKKEIDQLYCDFRGENEFANSLLSSF